jgi:thymidine phosphorylase
LSSHDWDRLLSELSPEPDALDRVIDAARWGELSDQEVASLATTLANSGQQLPADANAADVASTGGPGSLSTLLAPLFLVRAGFRVPKLGVPGRPAGGVDTLGVLPGYRTVLSREEVQTSLANAGYAHFEAAEEWAPLDAALFRRRQSGGAQGVPTLVIASLLAKKIAVGLRSVTLDVRVSSFGNFGIDMEQAATNAERFVRVAGLAGIAARTVLTDGTSPAQPAIGRGEALRALAHVIGLIEEPMDPWLSEHVVACRNLALGETASDSSPPGGHSLAAITDRHLRSQGSDLIALERYVHALSSDEQFPVVARNSGVLRVDLAGLRKTLIDAQRVRFHGASYPDAAGVTLKRRLGTAVDAGDWVAVFRARGDAAAFLPQVAAMFSADP